MHPPSPSSTDPPTSTQLILVSTRISATTSNYTNQNIARYWTISPNLGRKNQSYPFYLKVGKHTLWRFWFWIRFRIRNLDFRSFVHKIRFWANLGQRSQSCLFCLIFVLTSVFWNSKPKSSFWTNLSQKSPIVYFAWKMTQRVSREYDCKDTKEGLKQK